METSIQFWIGFNVFVLIMLALDLGVFHRHSHVVKVKEALAWSAVWIALESISGVGRKLLLNF
jgi:tellurite resistance protein TerC